MANKVGVSICMITYGHEKYIEQAISGILMQQCDFDFELVLVNDASPDASDGIIRQIIKTHPLGNRIKYFSHSKNKGIIPNFIFALQQCTQKYVAICDGDDYWNNPLKLQKQFDFLEKNKKVILIHNDVFTLTNDVIQENNSFKLWNLKTDDLDYRFCVFSPLAFTCTSFFRNIIEPTHISKKIMAGDWMLWVLLSLKGDTKFTNEKNAVYRIGSGVSVSANWYTDFYFRAIFLLKQLSLKHSLKKNYWLIRGAIYYILMYAGKKWKTNKILVLAQKLKYKI